MKKISNFFLTILLILSFFINLIPAKADSSTYYGYNNQPDNLAINGTASTGNQVASLPIGASVRLSSLTKHGTSGCSSGWYQVYYAANKLGYVCSKNLNTYAVSSDYNTDANFQSQLNAFPDSYKPFIKYLHSVYPNANFEAYNTGLDWNTVINEESYICKNAIQISNSNKEGWKNPQANNKLCESPNWYSANVDMIKYFMDPRNFLNEKYVFQFEKLSFNESTQTVNAVENMLTNTFMANNSIKDNNGNNISYAKTIFEAGKENSTSPLHLAARILQEQGTNGSGQSISGTVSGYNGYYNFYNIYAYASGGRTAVQNGLYYAKGYTNNSTSYGRPWNTPYKAIKGGAQWIADGYINVGQNSLYLQKFDIIGPSYYSHQYMINIQAANSEGGSEYKAYNKVNNYKNIAYTFTIPVYNNMPSNTYFASIKAGESTNSGTNNYVENNFQNNNNNNNSGGSSSTPAPSVKYGDVNSDGTVNSVDLLKVKKHIMGLISLNGNNRTAADVNKDGSINSIDLLRIKKNILGLISLK